MRAVFLALMLAGPALAEGVPGRDDPAFALPFARALQGDDPTALADLHAAAEAGNAAALLALPSVLMWLPPTGTLAERNRFRRVGGVPLAQAVSAADPVAAAWAAGDPGTDAGALLARAFALYAADEPDKATILFMAWLNGTGGFGDLPPGFWDQPVPPWAMALLLRGRLDNPDRSPPAAAEALLADRIRADDPAAWIALAAFAGLHVTGAPPPDTARLARIFRAAGVPQDSAARRMLAAAPVLRVRRGDPLLDPGTVAEVVATLRDDPALRPVLSFCAATCPATADACATAFVAGFGPPVGSITEAQPLVSLIATDAFFTTPRGRFLLMQSVQGLVGDAPARSVFVRAARAVDACLADAVAAKPAKP